MRALRLENGRPMLLAGIRRHHAYASAGETITAQWREFEELARIEDQAGSVAYGVMCGGNPDTQQFEYMCAVEVSSFDKLPASLGRMRVPAAYYAVFEHGGNVATVQETWNAIWKTWLPESGFVPANSPDFERYDEHFDSATGEGGLEIFFPIVESTKADA